MYDKLNYQAGGNLPAYQRRYDQTWYNHPNKRDHLWVDAQSIRRKEQSDQLERLAKIEENSTSGMQWIESVA